MTNTTNISRC